MAQSLAAVFVGSDTLLLQCVRAWAGRGHHVVAVVTDVERLRRACREDGHRLVEAVEGLASELGGEPVDFVFAITWLRMLPEAVIRIARRATINFHDGPLPRYAGLNATCWAILNGESEHAITWHVIEPAVDTGAILLQRAFPIASDDTAFTLNARCFEIGQETFVELSDLLPAGSVVPVAQDLEQRTYFGRHARPPHLAVLDFAQPAQDLARLVRAFDHGGYKNPVVVAKVVCPSGAFVPTGVQCREGSGAVPGTVAAIGEDYVDVDCGAGQLRLLHPRNLRGQRLGESALAAMGVARGVRLELPKPAELQRLTALGNAAALAEGRWVETLRAHSVLAVPDAEPGGEVATAAELLVPLDGVVVAETCAALCVAFLARITAQRCFSLGLRTAATQFDGWCALLAVDAPPIVFDCAPSTPVADVVAANADAIRAAHDRGPLLRELVHRRSDVLSANVVLEPPIQLVFGEPASVCAPGSLTFVFGADGALRLRYDAKASTAARVQALAHRLQLFVRAATASPGDPLAVIPVITEDERRRLLPPVTAVPTGVCDEHVVVAVEQRARATPDKIAVQHGTDSVSYAELACRVRQFAKVLARCGVRADDLVGILLPRGVDVVVVMLAALRLGAAYVPLDPSHPAERLDLVLQDAAPRVVVCTRATRPTNLPRERILAIDEGGAAGVEDVGDDTPVDGEVAYVIFTSGSTGRPKGVRVRHAGVRAFLAAMSREPGFAAEDRILAVTTISFDIAVLELLLPLVVGATVVIADLETAMDGIALAQLMEEARITVFQATPATFRLLLQSDWRGRPGLRTLCGGEAMTAELANELLPRVGSLWNMYGPTETTVWSSVHEVSSVRGLVPIGHAIAGTRLYVLDANRQLVPPGAVGELVIGGLGVAQGYHGRPDLTGEKFLVDDIVPAPGARMYRTGDLVRARSGEAGTFDYLGRIDFQVKVRGFRIELGEIESVLEAMPGIRQAVVSTWRDAAQELSLVAYFVSAGEPPAAKSLLEHARARLPAFMVPTAWVSLVEFPLTPNGKVDRKRLPPVGGQTPIARDVVEPRDDDERTMLAIFREKLGTSGIGVTDSFFDFGGHSLLALQVVRAVQERTGVTVPLVQIFRHPTVAGLVSSLRRDTKDAGHVIPLRDVGDGPLLYGICGIHLYQEVADSLGDGFRTYGVYIPADDHISSDVATGYELSVARDYWTTIKEHAKGRPVSLIGLCYGGMIAYEVAALAEADGATVDLLVLADSPLWTHMRRDHWRRVHGVVRRLLAKGAAAVRSRLRAARLLRTAGLDGSARSGGRGDESGRVDALRLRAQAFRPSCHRRGETILLRSQNEELYGTWRDDPMIGWSSFLEGANHLLPIRCTHLDILKGDAAVRVAGLIRDVRAKRLLAP